MGEHMNILKNGGTSKIVATAALTVAFLCLMPALLFAQEAQPAQAPAPAANQQTLAPVIKTESRLVLVDAVVTDKKGNYIHDLAQGDFRVFEDNKEQGVASFSSGTDAAAIQASGQKRYLILFFDNSTMAPPDQIQARNAARKFIEANAGPDRMMAVVDFGGALRIRQNFTGNVDLLRAAASGVKGSSVDPNSTTPVTVASAGLSSGLSSPTPFSSISNAEADFGARSMLLAVRSLAKNLRGVPGRKMLVLFSAGFGLTPERESVGVTSRCSLRSSPSCPGISSARFLRTFAPAGPGGVPGGTSAP